MATLAGDAGNNTLLGTTSGDSLSGLDDFDTLNSGSENDDGCAAFWLIDSFALISSTVLSPNPDATWHPAVSFRTRYVING